MRASLSLSNTRRQRRLAALPLLIALLLCIGVGQKAWGQPTLTVHDGTTTDGYVPVYGWYADAYLKSEFVYPASELSVMNGSTITAMTFYASQSSVSWGAANFQVFLREVSSTSISSFSGPGTTVYQGSLSISNSQMTITFTSPYQYNGGNLLVGVYNTVTGDYVTSTWYGESVSGASYQGYSYSSLGAVSGSQRDFLPKTTFTYEPAQISCEAPASVSTSNVTSNSVSVSWSGGSGTYNVEYKASGGDWIRFSTNTTATSCNITGLSPATTYQVRVQSVCYGDESYWRSNAFTTECAVVNLPYSYGFESSLASQCWSTYNCTSSSTGISSNDAAHSGANIFQFYYYESDAYLISPQLNANNAVELVFYYKNSSSYYDEQFQVGYTTTNSTDPSTYTYGSTITCTSTDWVEYANTFPAGTQHIAIKYIYTNGLYLYLDDFTFSSGSSCPKPNSLAVSDVTFNSATITWNAGGDETSWQYSLNNGSTWTTVTSRTLPLTGLTSNTAYTVLVRAYCSANDQSSNSSVSFTTPCSVSLPYTMGFESNESTIACWSDYIQNSNYSGIGSYYANVHNGSNAYTFYYTEDPGYLISPLIDDAGRAFELSFWYHLYSSYYTEQFQVGYTTSNNSDPTTFTYGPITYISDDSWHEYTNEFPAGTKYIAIRYIYTNGYATSFDDFTFSPISCPDPTDLVISDLTGTTATISWTESGEATNWAVEYSTNNSFTNSQTINVNGNPTTTITSLSPTTVYYVRVKAVCGGNDGESRWISDHFITEDVCPRPAITADVMPTSATLSWNGSSNARIRYGQPEVIYHEGFESGIPSSWTIIDNDGDGLSWEERAGDYSHESSYSATSASYTNTYGPLYPDNWLISPEVDLGGTLSVWLRGQDPEWAAEHFAIYLSTTGTNVDDFTITLLDGTDATENYVEYTANLGNWAGMTGHIAIRHFNCTNFFYLNVDDFTIYGVNNWSDVIPVNENPYTLTNLTPETNYIVQIQSYCDDEQVYSNWSGTAFTTPDICNAPNSLRATDVTSHSTNLLWNGIHETYDLQYFPCTPEELNYDNGTKNGNYTTSDGWYNWAVMFPAGSYSGNYLTTVSAYDNGAMSGTVSVFHGESEPTELLGIMNIAFTGANSFVEFTFPNPIAIDPSQNLWIVMGAQQIPYGSNPIAYCNTATDNNAKWFKGSDDVWECLSSNTYGWMIRAYSLIPDNESIIELTDVTSPVHLECLPADTYFLSKVRGNTSLCTNNHTEWSALAAFRTTNDAVTLSPGAIVSGYVFPCDNPYNGQTIGEATAATGINPSYRWLVDNGVIPDANDATYTITANVLSQLDESIHIFTREVKDACDNTWTASDGTFTLDLRVPSQPTTEYIDTVTCGDPVTITANAGSSTVVRYFWYDQPVNDNNHDFHVAITEAEQYTTGHLLTGDTTLYVCAVTYKVDGADTTDLCWSTPDTINIHVNPIVAPTITNPDEQYCGYTFNITPSGDYNSNHIYIWYKDAACTQEKQRERTLNLQRQHEETDFYLREFYDYNPGDGYICGSAPQSVHITLKPIEAPDDIDPVEICKGTELSIPVYAYEIEGTDLDDRHIAWYLSNDPEDTQIIDTTGVDQGWNDYTTLDGRSWHDLLGQSTTLYAAVATTRTSDNGPKTLTLPDIANLSNQLQGVFVTFQAGDIRVELDSIDLIPALDIDGSDANLSVYYRTGTIDYATCTDPAEWTALSASIDDGEAGHPTSLHLGESITLEAGDVISLFISAPGESFYYNEPSSNNTGIIASDNFITARTGWGFTYNSVVTGGFPTAEVSLTPRNLCGTVHYTVAGELTFGCLSARREVQVTVDSLPSVSAISGTVEPLCDGESLAADVLAALTPTVTWNTANEQSQTAQWMLSVDGADAVVLDDNTNIFRHDHDYTLIYRATNNCSVNSPDHQEATTPVEVYGAPTFTNGNAFTFTNSSENLCINSAISVQMPAWNNNGSEATEHWQYAIAKNADGEYIDPEVSEFMTLDLQQGISDTGDYYIRGYVKNDCGSDTTAIKTVSVYSKPAIEPVAETSLAFCFGAEIYPTVPEVSDNKYIAATGGRWLKVQDDEMLDPVELTFPQTADMTWNGVRICYAATNDCGTTYSDTITLTVHPDINVRAASNVTLICPAVGVELTATTDVADCTFEWRNNDEGGLQATTGNPVTAKNGTEDVNHFYTVIATDEFGCKDTAATEVAVVFHNDIYDETIEICELELPYTYTYGDQDTTLQRAGNHIVKFPQADGCDYVVNLTLAIREVTIIDYHGSICAAGESYIWDAVEGLEHEYTEAADDTVHVYYTGSQCDSILYCIHVTQGEPSLVVTDPQLSGSTGETLSTTVFGRSECDNNIKVAIEYDLYKDGELVNPDDYGTLNFTTAIPTLNLSFGRNVHAASGSIPASTFNMYNYQYGYFYLGFFGTAPNTVTATWNEPGEYKIVFRVVGRTGGMDYPYQSEPGVVIGGGGGTTTSVYATDSLIMRVSGEGGNEGQDADVNNGQNGMITISAVQDNPVIGATSTFAVNIENPNSSDPKTKVALDYEVYRDGQLLSELNGYGTLNFATYYDGTPAMVGRDLEYPDGSIPTATFHVGYYSYGYFTLGFWSQTNNEFTANWQQPGEYKVVFRLVERTGGTPYPLTYGTSTNDTIGGANGSNTGTVLDTNAIVFYIPVAEPAEADIDTIVCESNLPVMIHGTEFGDDAQEDLHVYSANGVYDTIYHLTLTVAPAYTAVNPVELDSVVCAFPFEWNGVTFEEAGSQTANLQTVLGCDSVVRMTVTLSTETGHKATEYACGSYIWHEGEEPITVSGTYTYNYENDYGCALTDTLDLTVYSTATTPDVVTVCGSYIWHEGEEPITVSGTYYYDRNVVYDNITCPVTDTLVLTVNLPLGTADTVEECGSYEWHGTTYTTSGTKYFDYEDADLNGGECPHVDTLYLTIFDVTPLVETRTVCGSYTWNGTEYTATGDYEYSYENDFGCPVTDTLHLTISQPNGEVITMEACESYEWHGTTYTTSGEYYYDYQDADVNGGACPHVDTLRLTISQPYGEKFIVEECGEFEWHGTTYSQSTVETYQYQLEEGQTCPRIDTLVLTVNQVYEVPDELEISVTALPYTYADTTFELGTQSGEYTVHLLTAAGCDSVVTLTLTVTGGSEGDAFLTVESISDNEFTVTAFANQVDPAEKVAIAYSITKDGEPVNIISHDCGGDLYIATDFNGSEFGQYVSYGEGTIPGNTFLMTTHYHDYFYFHFLNGRTNRFAHTFTEEGEYVVTLTLMSRTGGSDIFVPYAFEGSNMLLIGGEGSAEGSTLDTKTVTFSVGGGSNEPVNPAPMGVDGYTQQPEVTLFPNPARDIVTLRTNVENADCTITDMSGKVVLSATADKASDLQINVSQWAAGVYFVNLRSNGATVTQKLVITK